MRPPADLQAIQAGQHQIEHNDLGRMLARKVERNLSIGGSQHVEPFVLQVAAYQVAQALLVVDDKRSAG
jgi:hypothetical protein